MVEDVESSVSALVRKFEETRRREDLDNLLRLAQALAELPGSVLSTRIEHIVSMLGHLHGTDQERAHQVHLEAFSLHEHYESSRNPELLSNAILFFRIASVLGDADSLEGQLSLVALGMALCDDFYKSGDLGRLLESTAILREAFENTDVGTEMWCAAGAQLAISLKTLASTQGEDWSLDEALTIYTDLIHYLPDHPEAAASHYNYGEALTLRYRHSSNITDLDEAIAQYRSAVTLTVLGHRAVVIRRQGLAQALFRRFLVIGAIDDLNRAIEQLSEALQNSGVAPRHATWRLYASYLLFRYDLLRSAEDLRSSINVTRFFINAHNENTVEDKSMDLSLQGFFSLFEWESTGNDEDLGRAFRFFREAVSPTAVPPRWALAAIGQLRPDNLALAEEGHSQMRIMQASGLLDRLPEDALTALAKRFYERTNQTP